MSKPEIKWSCSMCTYENYLASSKCSVCLHPRGSEVIRLPPPSREKPLIIKDLQSSAAHEACSDFIICPPSCSSKSDVTTERQSDGAVALSSVDDFLIKNYDGHPKAKSDGETCDTKHELVPASSEQCGKSDKWKCNVCTYENWNASIKCVMCQNAKGSLENTAVETQPTASHVEVRPSSSSATLKKSKVNTTIDCEIKSNTDFASRAPERVYANSLKSLHRKQSEEYTTASQAVVKSRSPSLSSSNSHSSNEDLQAHGSTQSRANHQRRKKHDNQASSASDLDVSHTYNFSGSKILRSSSSSHLYSPGRPKVIDNRSFKNRTRNLNWLFLKACIGVVDGNAEAVDTYLAHGGNIARCLTLDEINSLERPSAFDTGHTLVHLAIRFQRHNILALLLTPEIAPRGFKRNPSHLSPDIADLIRREIMSSLRTQKGDFRCKFLSECSTFQLPIEICDLPSSVQQLLFDELLDQDAQKELEEESAINWSPSLLRTGDSNNRLYALWNRSAGDCLLDSVLQATWAVFDRDNVLRTAMSDSLQDCATSFYKRWRDWELQQADLLGYSLTERQCLQDWSFIHSLAQQPGASLEHGHIFVLSHILRRPIIIYGIKYLKSYRGETLGFAKFQGVYLPFLWAQSFCYTSPIALGYTRGHFTALVTMENDLKEIHAGARHRNPFNSVKYLPLVDRDGKILPIHFTLKGEASNQEQRKEILQDWLDCYINEDGVLFARQRPGKRSPSVTRLIDGWLDHYRHMSFRRLDEEGDSDDNDE